MNRVPPLLLIITDWVALSGFKRIVSENGLKKLNKSRNFSNFDTIIYYYFLFCFGFEVGVAYGAKKKKKNLCSNTLFNASKLPLHLIYSNRYVSVYKN